MFDAWKENRRKEKETKWLAEIRARDADVGVPSKDTMKERMAIAATARMWDVVDDCLQKGANVKDELSVSKKLFSKTYCAPMRKLGGLGLYGERGVAPLCIAVLYNDVKAAQNLLAQGGDPSDGYSGWGSDHFSPLMIAVRHNSPEMVKLLCDGGADLYSDTPLRLAEKKGYNDIIKIIRAEESKRAQGGTAPQPAPVFVPATAEDKIINDLEKLSPAAREKLLAAVNDKFAPPKTAVPGLSDDVVVLKPITLKQKGPQSV
ncbi:MAG: ankyrin repeat domain-containing protein [Alphaproteobacteria bacterium]